MSRNEENIITWFFMFATLLFVVFWGSKTWEFEARCSSECAPAASITPIYELQHTCFCSEGHGKWIRANIK
jgi:hypothetical protein